MLSKTKITVLVIMISGALAGSAGAQFQGACCLPDGTCLEKISATGHTDVFMTQALCDQISGGPGAWHAGQYCSQIQPPCANIGGVCCFPNGACQPAADAAACDAMSGGTGTFVIGASCTQFPAPCCDRSCSWGKQQTIILTAGTKDNFVGAEPSYPGAKLQPWTQYNLNNGPWLFFDSSDVTYPWMVFGHTFSYPWKTDCHCITDATLTFKIKAFYDGPSNDRFILMEDGYKIWECQFSRLNYLANNSNPAFNKWVIGDVLEYTVDLTNLPTDPACPPSGGGTWPKNIISTLENGDFDILVWDADTQVDYLELSVTVCDTCAIYKAGWPDYCPNGMPDFSQLQDFSQPHDGINEPAHDGPVAAANCLWWYDSRYQYIMVPDSPAPPIISDAYPLVAGWGSCDDHDASNVYWLGMALGNQMGTTAAGTDMVNFHNGILNYMGWRGLLDKYSCRFLPGEQVRMDSLADQVKFSQDVILLLGFYFFPASDPDNGYRIGGHYVTVAGVENDASGIAISDPYLDITNPGGLNHNNASIVSHDYYDVSLAFWPKGTPSWGEPLQLVGYPADPIAWDFLGKNGGTDWPGGAPQGVFETVIEAAEVICPAFDTCDYYKAQYVDYAPYGMPDFDQKQVSWIGATGTWSYDGPAALANCLWWFDSKFESGTQAPPTVYDTYPLVQDMSGQTPKLDDHESNNAIRLIQALAVKANCKPTSHGTFVLDLSNAAQSWIQDRGLGTAYDVDTLYIPSLDKIKTEVLRSQDLILLLGFYETLPNGDCNRLGGHYVTVAGTCVGADDSVICISDPWLNKNENEPPVGGSHGSSIHNDAQYVSGRHGTIHHDAYHTDHFSFACNHPLPSCVELVDYPDYWSVVSNFYDLNYTEIGNGFPVKPTMPYQGGDIMTLIDYAVMICPTYKCGDVNGDGQVNVGDAVYLINFAFKFGPSPVPLCIGDTNGDGNTNVGDIVYLINFVFKGGPPPVEPCCQ